MGHKRKKALQVVHPDCAGIDVGKREHYVAVHEGADGRPVRRFGSFTDELHAMAAWLRSCGLDAVAMEATGVYWIPVYEVLDRAGFEVYLVDARATKQVSGRNSDVLDYQWICQLMSYGLLRGAFRPSGETCVLRAFVRQRHRLTQDRARCVQHMQKALTQMNVQLDTVLSDRRVKADEATIARSLQAHLARGASVRPGSGAGALRLSRRADRAVRSPHGPDLDEPGLRHRSGRIGRATASGGGVWRCRRRWAWT